MLVLTLTPKGDEVKLTDKATGRHLVTVVITQVRGDHVRVGFTADRDTVDIARGKATIRGPKPDYAPPCPPGHIGT